MAPVRRTSRKNGIRLVSSEALTGLREMKREKERRAPLARDVRLLLLHLEAVQRQAEQQLRESLSAQSQSQSQSLSAQSLSAQSQSLSAQSLSAQRYAALARVALARVILFNRRRSKEVASIPVEAFASRKQPQADALEDLDPSVSGLERTLCGFFPRVEVRGSSGRMLPVLLRPCLESSLELLVGSRAACGVSRGNPFVFGRPGAPSAYSGSACVQMFVSQCGAERPAGLTAVSIRRHYAAAAQLLQLDEGEAARIFGPDHQIHVLRQDAMCDDAHAQSLVRLKLGEGQHGSYGEEAQTSDSLRKRDSHHRAKLKWEEEEVRAVERHLMRLIREGRVPQKSDCVRCLEAEPRALRTRSWRGIKDYVRNRITTLQRQEGSLRKPSNGSKRQEEPRQRTGDLQLGAQSQSLSAQRYAALARVALARVILFNRRRSKEVASIPVEAFASRKRPQADALEDLDPSVSGLERTLCGFFPRVEVRGSSGRMLPVLLRPCLESSLELLVGSRAACGVSRGNPFVFGRPGAPTAYSGSACVQMFVSQCGAERPAGLTAVSIRRHYAAAAQLLQLDEGEAARIFGPDHQIHVLRQDAMCDDAHAQSLVRLKLGEGQHGSYGETAQTSDSLRKRDSHHRAKLKWEEEEVRAVESHLMRLIREGRVPQKSDCVRCLEAEPRALRARSWRGIKDYVRNRITTLQRQEGSLRKPSNGSKRQEEPQQRTESSKVKLKWEEEEVRAVERHLMSYIEEQEVPPKSDCVRCLEAEPRALRTRSWRGIKDYVRNRITTLQRCKSYFSGFLTDSTKAKLKWDPEEVRAVEGHLAGFIQEGRVPQKSDCVRCLEAEPRALRTRSWRGIKDYVRNRITTLQRQRGSASKSLSSPEEPPQSARTYQQL
ncbi:unnamed protein product [Menidia menidia]|uniref:(Atlantic silverside) hypothetical protein n=1 Tax=Menidia menidia TaxID=238744 RepID=A0A8S4B6P9_9TELE|nr:unnamed protein product [Menidia menidia]